MFCNCLGWYFGFYKCSVDDLGYFVDDTGCFRAGFYDTCVWFYISFRGDWMTDKQKFYGGVHIYKEANVDLKYGGCTVMSENMKDKSWGNSELEKYAQSEMWYFWMSDPMQSIASYSILSENVRDIIQFLAEREDPHLTIDDYMNLDFGRDPRIMSCVERLVDFKPLTPLTGKSSEWEKIYEVGKVATWQNKRYCRVMKDTTLTGKLIKVYEWAPGTNDICEVKFPYWPGL